jgi:glyoxylase-like metal-dependent hydrolase (beta-lactamase superfamily II)
MKSFAFALVLACPIAAAGAEERLAPGLILVPGTANGAVLDRDGKSLAFYGDPRAAPAKAEMVLFTHARRDVTWAGRPLVAAGAKAVVPEKEADLFRRPETFWAALREKRFHDYDQQSTRVPVEPIAVERAVRGGDSIEWRGLAIRVLDTPGYTRGAVTYLLDLDGKRIAFAGDIIRDDGKIQDLYSLQDAIPAARIGGYHGWAGRLGDLVASIEKVAAEKPALIVPARGPAIRDPAAAIDRLLGRIRAVYGNYLSIDALRWYFKDDHIRAKARRVLGEGATVDPMPMAETAPLPPWVVAISNTRLILAEDRSGFLVDCGGKGIMDELGKMRASGKLAAIEGIFITHYHDDHTDAVSALVKECGAPVHACGSQVDVLERPGAYRLPCLTKNPIAVTGKREDGAIWRWKEFRLTLRDFPGQTLHHNALLVERDGGGTILFAGDSFTPSGIDDYCLPNRNFLHEGTGFFKCLDMVEKLPAGCFLVNQHVEPAFRFTGEQIGRMRETLRERRRLLADLFPFDDPDFGLDEGWASIYPYDSTVRPGESARIEVRITNHSPRERTFEAVLRAPEGLEVSRPAPVRIPARSEGKIEATVKVPAGVAAGLRVITAGLRWEDGDLREWTEALIEVQP